MTNQYSNTQCAEQCGKCYTWTAEKWRTHYIPVTSLLEMSGNKGFKLDYNPCITNSQFALKSPATRNMSGYFGRKWFEQKEQCPLVNHRQGRITGSSNTCRLTLCTQCTCRCSRQSPRRPARSTRKRRTWERGTDSSPRRRASWTTQRADTTCVKVWSTCFACKV